MRNLITGNELCARAAIDAGCRFFAGYPITPASAIFANLVRELPRRGGVAMSSPDEISAIAYCIGASLRGIPSMTATSGPGWCLMSESVGYALMAEVPVVIAVVQRLGPSTGGATAGAQGDIGLVSEAVSGGYRFPIFSPSTAAECYTDTLRAFYWAERLRSPVVLLSDKEVASTAEVVDDEDDDVGRSRGGGDAGGAEQGERGDEENGAQGGAEGHAKGWSGSAKRVRAGVRWIAASLRSSQ